MARGARVTCSVSKRDRGWRALLKLAQDLKVGNYYLKVGVLSQAKRGKGADAVTQAELAAIQHFGTKDGHIPPRPFIAMTFDKFREAYVALLVKHLRRFYEGKAKPQDILDKMGARIAGDIKDTVKKGAGVPPPNAPSTIERKLSKGRLKVRRNQKAGRWVDRATKQFVSADRVLSAVRTLVDSSRMVNAVTWAVASLKSKGKKK